MQMQSNDKKDGIEQPPSGRVKKSKKKKILIVLGIVTAIVIYLLFFVPALGIPSRGSAMKARCRALTNWLEHVEPYLSKNDQKPLSLIEICQAAYRDNKRPFPHVDATWNDKFPDYFTRNYELLEDPNWFRKEVPYGLFQSPEGWFIRELVPGKRYEKMLMIDQDGNIYELNEIHKDKYEYKWEQLED